MKSVITCDTEGIIKTMNTGAVKLFGYSKEEIIDKKRVSLFSPGEIVLQNVGAWLAEAATKGKYEGETIFVRKDGSKINANIQITPLYGDGKDKPLTGYCGVTEELEKEVEVPIKGSTKFVKFLAITRMPFLSAVLMPGLIGGAFASSYIIPDNAGISFNTINFILTLIGIMVLHLASNVLNDYFDNKDGTDEANSNYFLQYSGGSRAIELGLITLEGTKRLGLMLAGIALAIGIYLTYATGLPTLYIGLAGLFLGYFYTAPPLRLVALHGLGEFTIMLTFGPLVTLGTVYVLTGLLSWEAFLIGIPAGLLTTNILLINEFPDAESDATTGKNHLVVTFGKKASTYIYLFILLLSAGVNYYIWDNFLYDNLAFIIVSGLSLLFGLTIWAKVRTDYMKRILVKQNIKTIALSALSGLGFALAIWFG